MAYEKVRWGLLGCGGIAKTFAKGLEALDDAELVAVGSRTQETADAWAPEVQVPRRHPSYEALANDPDVDVVYIATPHPFHKDNALLCLDAGKHVLCEKPFAMNAAEAQSVIRAARAKNLFCMEAMWPRFLPAILKAKELLADGAIGEIRMVRADFSFRCGWEPKSRLLDPKLGGGGLLDVGCYTLALASMVLGKPARVTGLAEIGRTGVDEQAGIVLGYDGGQLAVLFCGVRTNLRHEARIVGTEGDIVLPAFWHASKAILEPTGKDPEEFQPEFVGNGYNYEAAEVARCLRAGLTESDGIRLDETLEIMQTMDELRAQWGLKYPME